MKKFIALGALSPLGLLAADPAAMDTTQATTMMIAVMIGPAAVKIDSRPV